MHYQNMLEKQAMLIEQQEEFIKVANPTKAEYKEALREAKEQYRSEKEEIADKYSDIRSGAGLLGAGGYAAGRGVGALKGKKKFGLGGALKTLGAGAGAHMLATGVTHPMKKAEKQEAYDEIVNPVRRGEF